MTLSFIYSPDFGQTYYNYRGTNLTSILPITGATYDSVRVDTTANDTLVSMLRTTVKDGNDFYLIYDLENYTDTSIFHIKIMKLNLSTHTRTDILTNLTMSTPYGQVDAIIKDNIMYLNMQTSTTGAALGIIKTYKASLSNLSTFVFDRNLTDSGDSFGTTSWQYNGVYYTFFNQNMSGNYSDLYLRMIR
jgi:hypothetical protein